MPSITNDQQLKSALNELPLKSQRAIGMLFANSIQLPSVDSSLAKAMEMIMESEYGESERELAYKTAKSVATKTYTACGRDTDWDAQAEHFVAAACSAALTPEGQISAANNPAWKAAIQARMANNCLMMDKELDEPQNEAVRQYQIAEEFLQAQP
jgi:hypothetical protein